MKMPIEFPEGLFDVIVADPPWRSDFGKTCSRATERHYPTMELEEICSLQIPAANGALLFMWATAPMLAKSLRVMTRWGFEYRTNMVWCKDKAGTGKWVRNQHEHILIGRRGMFPAPIAGAGSHRSIPPSVFHAPRKQHSQKPEGLQDMIERVYPLGDGHRYLELFARRTRENWAVWGNDPALIEVPA